MKVLKVGQKVEVSYTATVYSVSTGEVAVRDGAGVIHWYKDSADVSFEVIDPKNWPPQIGDIWKLDNNMYFVTETDRLVTVFNASFKNGFKGYLLFEVVSGVGNQFKDASPDLVSRRT